MVNVKRAIYLAVKTGRVLLGARRTVESVKTGRAKLLIMAANCPEEIRKDLEYYCNLSRIPIYIYKGSSIDLGVACKKRFKVSALAIREPGESDIMKLMEEGNV